MLRVHFTWQITSELKLTRPIVSEMTDCISYSWEVKLRSLIHISIVSLFSYWWDRNLGNKPLSALACFFCLSQWAKTCFLALFSCKPYRCKILAFESETHITPIRLDMLQRDIGLHCFWYEIDRTKSTKVLCTNCAVRFQCYTHAFWRQQCQLISRKWKRGILRWPSCSVYQTRRAVTRRTYLYPLTSGAHWCQSSAVAAAVGVCAAMRSR